jgi:hypothetical protein
MYPKSDSNADYSSPLASRRRPAGISPASRQHMAGFAKPVSNFDHLPAPHLKII